MKNFVLLLFSFICLQSSAQLDETQTGAWYMLFWNTQIKDGPWGFQGDVQYRNWNIIGDLEQLLLRGGLTYTPKNSVVKLTLGYANISTGVFGDSDAKSFESRIYQEALIPHKAASRLFLTHRFRYEQRFVETQDFRTRYRYNLFVNIPLNQKTIEAKTVYLALYNELFVNGQKEVGNDQSVALFDRNRFYSALGYAISKDLKTQVGLMRQSTDNWSKNQLQLSLHANF
ncbi:MAG: DUF2490 domain-containing protein [Bacteroidota bacterium]